MAERFDNFTEGARIILTPAQEKAQRFNHNHIGTEHLLLGLAGAGDSAAAKVQAAMGVELPKLRSAVVFRIGRGQRVPRGMIQLTPGAKRALELGLDEARRLDHHHIGAEHILLALVREAEGIAAGVLNRLGVGLGNTRAQVISSHRR